MIKTSAALQVCNSALTWRADTSLSSSQLLSPSCRRNCPLLSQRRSYSPDLLFLLAVWHPACSPPRAPNAERSCSYTFFYPLSFCSERNTDVLKRWSGESSRGGFDVSVREHTFTCCGSCWISTTWSYSDSFNTSSWLSNSCTSWDQRDQHRYTPPVKYNKPRKNLLISSICTNTLWWIWWIINTNVHQMFRIKPVNSTSHPSSHKAAKFE